MARLIPLYSTSSQLEIERRAQRLFEQKGRHSESAQNYWQQAEADYLKQLRNSPLPTYIGAPVHHHHFEPQQPRTA